MIETIGIPLAFAVFSIMSMWIIIGCRGYWFAKGLFIVASMCFSVCLWNSLDNLSGWPCSAELPEEFEIKWIYAEEGNLKPDSPKAIFVWAIDLHPENADDAIDFSIDKHIGTPRVYTLPYSKSLHKQSLEIQKQIAEGRRFYGTSKSEEKCDKCNGSGKGKGGGKCDKCNGSGKGKGKGKGNGEGKGGGSLSRETDKIFHELPQPHLPEKNINSEAYEGQSGPTLRQ